ncbi:MAG: YraN family protein [Oscillospiraceae bacterium]|jgi:putative endonuclease|nr:YraN family protein [Oscillospiraceae bacterium]
MKNLERGKLGEQLAAKYLTGNGFKIAAMNYHSKYGELDIVATNHQYLLFVEVKTRKARSLVNPAEAINYPKIQKIVKTAESFLYKQTEICHLQPRFDVIEIVVKSGTYKLNHIKAAFDSEGIFFEEF